MPTLSWLQKPEGKNHLEDLSIDGKIILQGMLWKCGGRVWTGCIWLRIRTSGRPL
jgi:hypothetical protein